MLYSDLIAATGRDNVVSVHLAKFPEYKEEDVYKRQPLCINVLRLLNYRLAPDELILFDWLTVKQISFKYKPFHYSRCV